MGLSYRPNILVTGDFDVHEGAQVMEGAISRQLFPCAHKSART